MRFRWLIAGLLSLAVVAPTVAPVDAQPAPRPARRTKKPPADLDATVAALANANVEVAAAAAEKLAGYDHPAAHEALLDALALGVPPSVAAPVLAAVAARPAPTDIASLARYAGHRNPAVRSPALDALARYADPAARAAVVAGLRDRAGTVRAAAAAAIGRAKLIEAADPLLVLLARGEEAAARSLAALADPELARRIAEHFGKVPEPTLALCLGAILKRPDFGPDTARVEVVRAIGKIQDAAAIAALTDYIDSVPKNQQRPSKQEASAMVDARLGGK